MAELNYDFFSPPQVVFGWGRRTELGRLAGGLGRRAWIVAGSRTLERSGTLTELCGLLSEAGLIAEVVANISREPLVTDVDLLVQALRERRTGAGDVMIAVGGGSAIDLAKAAGALVMNPFSERGTPTADMEGGASHPSAPGVPQRAGLTSERGTPTADMEGGASHPSAPGVPQRAGLTSNTVKDFLEGVGRGLKIVHPPLPLLAMPTTGGTGTEATKNAVISSFDPPFKKSLRSEWMVPRCVLIDPELSCSVPPDVTAWTGLDAITQCLESYITLKPRPIPQALGLQGLKLAVPALPEAVRDGQSVEARCAMAHAAFLSGMALANSGLGVAHGIAASLGVHAHVSHGLACAVLLPTAIQVNRGVRERELAYLGTELTGRSWSTPAMAIDALADLIGGLLSDLSIPHRLSQLGVKPEQLDDLAAGSQGNSLNGNPRELSVADVRKILEELL